MLNEFKQLVDDYIKVYWKIKEDTEALTAEQRNTMQAELLKQFNRDCARLEGADGLMELLKQNLLGISAQDGVSAPASPQPEDIRGTTAVQTRIYRFENLDEVMSAAKVVGGIYQGSNTLYKKPGTSQYYLVLSSADTDPLVFSRVCNILAEYGGKVRQQSAVEAYYQEHYEVIIQQGALQKLMLV